MEHSIRVGYAEQVKRVLTQSDFDRFAALSGDDNPIHVDPDFAARSAFGRTVAHGMFLYGLVSSVLGTRLSGAGALQLEQELLFPNPTFADEEIAVRVEVTAVRSDENLAELDTRVVRPGGELGLQGRALVRLPGAAQLSWDVSPVPSDALEPGASFKGLAVGQRAETRRAFTRADVEEYVQLTGDANPLFTDAAAARRAGLAGTILPGSLLGGLFSFLLGVHLPGYGTNYLKQRLSLVAPAYAGQELVAAVEIVRLRPDKMLVNLRTTCTDPAGDVVCHGEALVLARDVAPR